MPHELRIDARCRTVANATASLMDFATTPTDLVDAQWLILNPHVNLYCIDVASSQAIFVEVASEVNLATAPFVYQAQYEGAQRLFTMPLAQLLELGERLETNLDRLILTFNIGRCGSTLLHQIFNQLPGVVSLSEPDGFIPFWGEAAHLSTGETTALINASAKFIFRSQVFPDLTVPAIKLRARNLGQLKLFHFAFPQATLLFIYRETIGWVASWMRVAQRLTTIAIQDKTPLEDLIARFSNNWGPISLAALGLVNFPGPLSAAQGYAFAWLLMMDCYLRYVREGLPIAALSYSDLNHRRQETLARLFAICALPLDAVQPALAAYERDSQAGTVMGREEQSEDNATRLTAEQLEEIRLLVGCHPIIRTPEFVVPGTIASISD
jgi:hypothetical protein